MKKEVLIKSQFSGKVREMVKKLESLRSDHEEPVDISLQEYVKENHQLSLGAFYADLGINPSIDSIQNIVKVEDMDVRWIIPEIFREAINLGYRRAPIYPNIIAVEEQMKGLQNIIPQWNMSDATPERVGEAETIPLGSVSYGSKKFEIYKIGKGLKLSYEVINYSSINTLNIFLRDFGIKLGHATDVLAINTLINGDLADGSESIPVMGVTTPGTKAYSDLLRIWIRASRMGRNLTTIIGGEASALATLNLDEFKKRESGTPASTLNLKTPLPNKADYFVHGVIPSNQEILVDPSAAMGKFNAIPLMVESERIVSNQTQATYVTLTTGFAKFFRDASMLVDSSLDISTYGFPTWMDIDSLDNVQIL